MLCTRTTNYGLSTCQEDTGYGYHVMVEYRKEIKVWLIIRSGDAEGYQRFYNFLPKCESITQSAQWNQLMSYACC